MESVRVHGDAQTQPGGRLNVLLMEAEGPWADQLPRLLEPQGVRTIRATSVDEAVEVIEHVSIHAALVDLATPMGEQRSPLETGGLKLLRVIRRLRPTPPAVVVRGRIFDRRTDDRVLSEALKLEAFSVLDQPVELEQVLETLRRLLQRHYGGLWPKAGTE